MERLLIWWTDERDCKNIGPDLPETLPEYLQSEYSSRYGRNGRGRLWTHSSLENVSVDPWPENALGRKLRSDSAGIVFREEDKKFIDDLFGIITDCDLKPIM